MDISSPSKTGVVKPGQHPSPGQGNTPAGSRQGSRAVTPVPDRPPAPAAAATLRTPPPAALSAQQEPMAIDLTLSDDEEDAPAAPTQPAVADQAAHAAQPAVAAGTSPLAPAPWAAQSIPPPSPAVGSPELLTPQAHAAALAAAAQAEEEAADAQSRQSQQQRVASALGDFADRLMRKLVGRLSCGHLICSNLHASADRLPVWACLGCAVLSGQVQCHPQHALLCMPCGSLTCGGCKIPACAHTWGECQREASLALPCSRWGRAQSQSALPSAKPWQMSRSRLLLRTGCRWLRFWTECLGAQAAMLLTDKTKPVRSGFALLCRVLVPIDKSLFVLCAWVLLQGEPTGCQEAD